MISHAVTCTGPYAILIMLGIKRVENRSACPSPAKGRCAVSCSKSFCKEEFGNFVQWASRALPSASIRIGIVSGGFHLPRVRELADGILGERAKSVSVIPAYGPHSGRNDWFRHHSFVRSALAEIRKRKGA